MRSSPMLAVLLLAASWVLAPASVMAGTCPALEGGVVDKDRYALGETIPFWGNYNDFADPGTVAITFVRQGDGTTKEYKGQNLPDGAWFLNLVLDATLRGTWDVTVVVDQTGAHDTCTDRVTIGSVTEPPGTSTVTPIERGDPSEATVGLLLAAGAIALAGVAISGRSRDRR